MKYKAYEVPSRFELENKGFADHYTTFKPCGIFILIFDKRICSTNFSIRDRLKSAQNNSYSHPPVPILNKKKSGASNFLQTPAIFISVLLFVPSS